MKRRDIVIIIVAFVLSSFLSWLFVNNLILNTIFSYSFLAVLLYYILVYREKRKYETVDKFFKSPYIFFFLIMAILWRELMYWIDGI